MWTFSMKVSLLDAMHIHQLCKSLSSQARKKKCYHDHPIFSAECRTWWANWSTFAKTAALNWTTPTLTDTTTNCQILKSENNKTPRLWLLPLLLCISSDRVYLLVWQSVVKSMDIIYDQWSAKHIKTSRIIILAGILHCFSKSTMAVAFALAPVTPHLATPTWSNRRSHRPRCGTWWPCSASAAAAAAVVRHVTRRAKVKELPLPPGKPGNAFLDLIKSFSRKKGARLCMQVFEPFWYASSLLKPTQTPTSAVCSNPPLL